jgi:hypothetical protein
VATEHGVQLRDLDPEASHDAACRLAGRNFTREDGSGTSPADEPYHVTGPQWPSGK